MFRLIAGLIVALLVISMLRPIIGLVARGFADLAKGPAPKPQVPEGGELKKDPVCGTFVSTSTPFQRGGAYFCSAECRDRYPG